ncbi:MAG: CAP domain-containing protein [Microcoleaceae cyanobacterium]
MPTFPSAQDQYMLELVNRARANPQAEADRLLSGNLNEGLAAGTISTDPKQPLAWNANLGTAAAGHTQDMFDDDFFAHTNPNTGSTPRSRATAAGYTTQGGVGENIAVIVSSGSLDLTTATSNNQDNLFVDANYPGRGHRVAILRPNYREIGVSNDVGNNYQGPFSSQWNSAAIATQNFGYANGGNPFITGVAYTDGITDDDFYTVGEGLGGVSVTAVDIANSANTFTTTTWSAGGYSIEVTPGATYNISFSGDFDGDNQSDTVSYQVSVGSKNVKQDLVTDSITFAPQPTPGDDNLIYTSAAETIDALAGNDIIRARGGNDNIFGNSGNDKLFGDSGRDTIDGGADNDTLLGGGGNDLLIGGSNNDILNGGNGNDILIGVDENSENPGGGERDTLIGKGGNDTFILGNANTAFYQGNRNTDRATIRDFAEGDIIQLNGNSADYLLRETRSGHTNIFLQPVGEVRDLVGIVQNVTELNINDSSQFSFV